MADDTPEVLTRAAPAPDLTLRYGDDVDHVVDVRLPGSEAPAPVVVVLHGGFWRAAYDRAHTGPQASALAAAGYVVAVPEYRRVGQPGGGWPGTFDDLTRCLDRLPSLLSEAVGERTDGSRTVLVGHSAGGQLALWAAGQRRWALSGVVSLGGVCDLGRASALRLGAGAADALLGGSPEEVGERFAQADPVRLVPTGVRTHLLHGIDDAEVPVELSRRYAAAARAHGDQVRLVELESTGHYELIDPASEAWPHVLEAISGLASS